jgi:hypothetical protein
MKLPALRRLVKEDFEQQYKELVGKIGQVVNSATENISLALNKNLTFADNMSCSIVNITISVDSSGNPINSTSFPSNLSSKTNHLWITRAVCSTNPSTYVTGAPFVSWVDNNGQVTINNITGLPANTSFNITMIVAI